MWQQVSMKNKFAVDDLTVLALVGSMANLRVIQQMMRSYLCVAQSRHGVSIACLPGACFQKPEVARHCVLKI